MNFSYVFTLSDGKQKPSRGAMIERTEFAGSTVDMFKDDQDVKVTVTTTDETWEYIQNMPEAQGPSADNVMGVISHSLSQGHVTIGYQDGMGEVVMCVGGYVHAQQVRLVDQMPESEDVNDEPEDEAEDDEQCEEEALEDDLGADDVNSDDGTVDSFNDDDSFAESDDDDHLNVVQHTCTAWVASGSEPPASLERALLLDLKGEAVKMLSSEYISEDGTPHEDVHAVSPDEERSVLNLALCIDYASAANYGELVGMLVQDHGPALNGVIRAIRAGKKRYPQSHKDALSVKQHLKSAGITGSEPAVQTPTQSKAVTPKATKAEKRVPKTPEPPSPREQKGYLTALGEVFKADDRGWTLQEHQHDFSIKLFDSTNQTPINVKFKLASTQPDGGVFRAVFTPGSATKDEKVNINAHLAAMAAGNAMKFTLLQPAELLAAPGVLPVLNKLMRTTFAKVFNSDASSDSSVNSKGSVKKVVARAEASDVSNRTPDNRGAGPQQAKQGKQGSPQKQKGQAGKGQVKKTGKGKGGHKSVPKNSNK